MSRLTHFFFILHSILRMNLGGVIVITFITASPLYFINKHPARIITQASITTSTHSGTKKAIRIPNPKAETVTPMLLQEFRIQLPPYATLYVENKKT